MAYHHTWFGSSKTNIFNSVGQLLGQWKTASNSTLQVACKGVFSAHVCLVQSLSGHFPSGGRDATVLVSASQTERFLYWMDDLLAVSLPLQKSHEESGQALDMLVDNLPHFGLVLNAAETKISTRQNQHPAKLLSPGGTTVEILAEDQAKKCLSCMISTPTQGGHGLDPEHEPQAASSAFYANLRMFGTPFQANRYKG